MRSAIREAIETIALAAFIVLVLQATVQNYQVDGPSMDPTLANLDRVLVNKAVYIEIDAERVSNVVPGLDSEAGTFWHPFHPPQRGDVIVFRWPLDPRKNFVKRIIGVPGDTVRIQTGTVFVNGVPQVEPYVERGQRQSITEVTVPEGSYYVLGDNRMQSDDSRHWGFVPQDNIVGKVWLAYWPLDTFRALFSRGIF